MQPAAQSCARLFIALGLLLAGASLAAAGPPGSSRRALAAGDAACVGKEIVVLHAGPRPNLAPISSDQPPINKLEVTEDNVAYVDAGDSPCLRGVEEVPGTLIIWDNGELQDLSVLSALKKVGKQLIIYGSNNGSSERGMTSLAGLEGLESVGDSLVILHTKQLRDLGGLAGLTSVKEDFNIVDNKALNSLEGLQSLKATGDDLRIDNCPQLHDLKGLESLERVGYDLIVIGNNKLKSLEGLGALKEVGGELWVANNRNLTSTKALEALEKVGISVAVASNPLLADLDGLAQLTQVKGDLLLDGLPSLTSLAPLAGIKSVGLNLVVTDNAQLKDLAGLEGVETVGLLLNVAFNPQLQSLKGLGSLRDIGQEVYITDNKALTSLDDFGASLASVGSYLGGNIFIKKNPQLAELGPLGLAGPQPAVKGRVVLEDNGEGLPAAQAQALMAKGKPKA